MGKLIARLHQHPLHDTAHYQPYLARYHNENFQLLDHYRHLLQLLPIYRAIEVKMREADFHLILPEHLHFALTRSKEIEKDLDVLAQLIPNAQSNQLVKATSDYASLIDQLDVSTQEGKNTIFAHFLLRILGDLFGGQGLKQGVTDALKRGWYNPEGNDGRAFYVFPDKALNDFAAWLKAESSEHDDAIVNFATDAYQRNINIFIELEQTRVAPKPAHSQQLASISKNASSFFNCSNATKIAVGVTLAAAAVTTAVISRSIN